MGKYIPVEPEKWAAMVKAQSDLPRWKEICDELDARCNELKAENERLRKAGDAMADAFELKYPVAGGLINAWNAAKEGKQP